MAASVTGAVASTRNSTVLSDPWLPATSVDRNATVYAPGAPNSTGAVYARQAPPPTRYSKLAAPEPLPSLPASDICTGVSYQPLGAGRSGSSDATVPGGVRSMLTSIVLGDSVFPARSTER